MGCFRLLKQLSEQPIAGLVDVTFDGNDFSMIEESIKFQVNFPLAN